MPTTGFSSIVARIAHRLRERAPQIERKIAVAVIGEAVLEAVRSVIEIGSMRASNWRIKALQGKPASNLPVLSILAASVSPLPPPRRHRTASGCSSKATWSRGVQKAAPGPFLRAGEPVQAQGSGRLAHPRARRRRQSGGRQGAQERAGRAARRPEDRRQVQGPSPPAARSPTISGQRAWVIPADYPTGSFSYKVVATDMEGQTQTWEPFKRRGPRSSRSWPTLSKSRIEPGADRDDASLRARAAAHCCPGDPCANAGRTGGDSRPRRRVRSAPKSRRQNLRAAMSGDCMFRRSTAPGHAADGDGGGIARRAGIPARLAHRQRKLEGRQRRIQGPRVQAGRLRDRQGEIRCGRSPDGDIHDAGGFRLRARHRAAAGRPPVHPGLASTST